jgi:hypothetical protein
MFALTRGEFLLAAFIFGLVWAASAVPRYGQRLGARLAARRERDGG